jgi:hypothetical protein
MKSNYLRLSRAMQTVAIGIFMVSMFCRPFGNDRPAKEYGWQAACLCLFGIRGGVAQLITENRYTVLIVSLLGLVANCGFLLAWVMSFKSFGYRRYVIGIAAACVAAW